MFTRTIVVGALLAPLASGLPTTELSQAGDLLTSSLDVRDTSLPSDEMFANVTDGATAEKLTSGVTCVRWTAMSEGHHCSSE